MFRAAACPGVFQNDSFSCPLPEAQGHSTSPPPLNPIFTPGNETHKSVMAFDDWILLKFLILRFVHSEPPAIYNHSSDY